MPLFVLTILQCLVTTIINRTRFLVHCTPVGRGTCWCVAECLVGCVQNEQVRIYFAVYVWFHCYVCRCFIENDLCKTVHSTQLTELVYVLK